MYLAQAIDYPQGPYGEPWIDRFGTLSLGPSCNSGAIVHKKRSIDSASQGLWSSFDIAPPSNPAKRTKLAVPELSPRRPSQLWALRDKYDGESDVSSRPWSSSQHRAIRDKYDEDREELLALFDAALDHEGSDDEFSAVYSTAEEHRPEIGYRLDPNINRYGKYGESDPFCECDLPLPHPTLASSETEAFSALYGKSDSFYDLPHPDPTPAPSQTKAILAPVNISSAAKHWLMVNKIMLMEENFHLFANLPEELQDSIWDFALSAPKQLTIGNVIRPQRFFHHEPDLHDFHSDNRISLEFRNICLASREAYARFQHSRPPKFSYRNTAWMINGYWNFENDSVVLSDCSFFAMWDFVKDFRVEVEKIRTLVIAPRQHLSWKSGENMLEMLRSFKNLETVLLVWGYEYHTSSDKWSEKLEQPEKPKKKPETIGSQDNSNPHQWVANFRSDTDLLDMFLEKLQKKWPEWKMPALSTCSRVESPYQVTLRSRIS